MLLAISARGEVDAAQLSSILGEAVEYGRVREFEEKMGGLSGEFVTVEVKAATERELILKQTGKEKATAIALGTAREGVFYGTLARELSVAPAALHAFGDLATGEKQVLMEKVSGVPAGVCFGPGNPNNWSLSAAALAEAAAGRDAVEVTRRIFVELYAPLHSRFWRDASVLRKSWLRGADWHRGEGRDAWDAAQRLAADAWTEQKRAPTIKIDARVAACLDASFAKIAWTPQRETFTVVHGDAHPHNVLLGDDGRLTLIDFEMVGVGSGPQELGQFLISHMDPALRRAHERDLVRAYFDALRLPEAYDFDACWSEYLDGAAGRWLWFVPYLAKVCPPEMGQFFHDQLAAFLADHFPDPALVPMPRV
mmetsp:Transcript_19736/g.62126  ORF Transcript_19736/g.62126 Transcript_19736/m.62126 type:complete len:367 (-) Transcript_19736:66-1166(-)